MDSPNKLGVHTRIMSPRKAGAIQSVALLIVYGVTLFQLRGPLANGYSDFISFYSAGTILRRGERDQLYDITRQSKIQRAIAPNVPIRQAALPFVRPAFEAWIFWPFAYLPYSVAFILWNIVSIGCLIVAILILRQEIPELLKISLPLTLATCITYFPVFFTVLQGQDSLLLLLIYVCGFRALRRGRPILSGFTFGLAIIKFTLILPFLVPFALRRKVHVLLGFILSFLILSAISIITVGPSAAIYYPKYLLTIDSLAPGVNRAQDMPNLRGMLQLILPRLSNHSLFLILVPLSIGMLLFAARQWAIDYGDRSHFLHLGFSLNLLVTLLVSYHCHVFDLSILLLPAGAAIGFLSSEDAAYSKPTPQLIWTTILLMFSPLYLMLTFYWLKPSVIGLLVVAFACSLSLSISALRADKRLGASKNF